MIHIAVREARKSSFDARHGAVVTKSNSVLSRGYNQLRYFHFPKTNHPEESLHAEIDAIRKLLTSYKPNQLKGTTLYVARIGLDGKRRMSKPCYNCQTILRYFGIQVVYFTDINGQTKGMKL